jgi:type IV pilus assembly protein PilE
MHANRRARRVLLGFTLVELLITVVIASILISIAVPTYQVQVRKSRRTEAKTAALDAAAREERFYATQNRYSSDTGELGYTSGSGSFPVSTGTYYEINIPPANVTAPTASATGVTTGSFTITVDAPAGSPQQADTACQTFVVTQTGARTATDSGGADNSTWFGRGEQFGFKPEIRRDVFIPEAAPDQLGVFAEHAFHDRQGHAEARRHVTADAQVLGVQPHPKTRRIAATDHVRRTVHEVPAAAGALAQGVHQLVQRQLMRLGKSHGFGDRLDDPGAHDLVGGFRGLTVAAATEVGDGPPQRRQDRLGARECRGVTAAHHGQGAIPGALDTAADGTVQELNIEPVQGGCGTQRRGRADGRAVDDQLAGTQARPHGLDDIKNILVRRYAQHQHLTRLRECRGCGCGLATQFSRE